MFMVRNNIPRIELQTVVDAGKIEQLLTNVKKKMLETKQTRKIESTSKAEIAPEPELNAKELMFKVILANNHNNNNNIFVHVTIALNSIFLLIKYNATDKK